MELINARRQILVNIVNNAILNKCGDAQFSCRARDVMCGKGPDEDSRGTRGSKIPRLDSMLGSLK